jgi:hypothetical protein
LEKEETTERASSKFGIPYWEMEMEKMEMGKGKKLPENRMELKCGKGLD